jgi:hypothetical protein
MFNASGVPLMEKYYCFSRESPPPHDAIPGCLLRGGGSHRPAFHFQRIEEDRPVP